MICICGKPLAFTPGTVNGAAVFEDTYLILVTCEFCFSTRAAVMWESEEVALESAEGEPVAAE